MVKVYYNNEGWVCNRYPYDIPIDDINRYIEVSENEYQKTLSCLSHNAWRVVNGTLVEENYEKIPAKEIYIEELQEIEVWFASTDYIPNKIVTNEWDKTDPRWVAYITERLVKRARRDELLQLLEE